MIDAIGAAMMTVVGVCLIYFLSLVGMGILIWWLT